MGKKSSPNPRNVEAAGVEGKYSKEIARDTTYADRPDQYNPFGKLTWGTESSIDPATGKEVTKWTQNQSLSDDMQGMFDDQMSRYGTMSDMSSGMMGRVQSEMGAAPDWEQFGDIGTFDPTQQRQAAEDAAYAKSTSRLDPRFEREAEAMEIKLRNQGLRPGDQAYDASMSTFGNTRNDAYEHARLGSVAQGRDEFSTAMQGSEYANALRDKSIQEYLNKRNFSLNEAESLNPTAGLSEMANTYGGGAST